jgi:hypothetical protein
MTATEQMMNVPALTPVQVYNEALEHPSIWIALRHLADKNRAVHASTLVEHLAGSERFPEVSIKDLIYASGQAGQPLKALCVNLDELAQLPLPVLTYLHRTAEEGGPVDLIQLETVGRAYVLLSSGPFGKTQIKRSVFDLRWTGIVLVADLAGDASCAPSEIDAYADEVSLIDGLLSPAECLEMIDYCEQSCFRRSQVAKRNGAARDPVLAASIRSSSTAVLSDRAHPVLARLYQRCARQEGVAPSKVEDVQCVRYKRGQRFRPHYDGGVNLPRLTTYLLYLNDDFEGGETYFPMLDRAISPRAGSCLRFPDCDRDGRVRWPSEHGGLPVRQGIKYALNIWVRCPGPELVQ